MSYGTRANTATAAEVAARRRLSKAAAAARDDPTVIPSTAPLGFLGRLPWKIGGTLRYKPSAADLQEHPGMRGNNRRRQRPRTAETQDGTEPGALGTHDEHEPLLGHSSDEYEEGEEHGNHYHHVTPRPRRRPDNIERHDYSETPPDYATATSRAAGGHAGKRPSSTSRKRSGTTGSGDTSDSYRSRNDLFPSDGEGDEDAVPLDDEFADALGGHNMSGSRILDDHGSTKTRSSSATKGKRPAGGDAAAHANTYVYSSPVSSKGMSRSASRTTIASSNGSIGGQYGSAGASAGEGHMSTVSIPEMKEQQHKRPSSRNPSIPSLEDLAFEEEQARQEEDAEIERKREAARRVAEERGLLVVDSHVTNPATAAAVADAAAVTPPAKALAPESEHGHDEMVKAVAAEPERDYKGTADIKEERPPDNDEQLSREIALRPDPAGEPELRGPDERAPSSPAEIKEQDLSPAEDVDDEFVPARLPHFR